MLNNVSVCETVRTGGSKNKISEKKWPIARDKEVTVTPDVDHEFWSYILLYSFGDFETAFGRPF